jgi:phenylalanyl-tRNA synthetase beta chain
MKLSLKWIKDYVKIPDNWDLSRLVDDLTMSTVEVENITELGKKFDKMVVGVIDEVTQHPNADKLRICRTRIGHGDVRNIVCGGANLSVGMKVVVATPGAMARWHGEGEPVEIGLTKIRGEQSYGMI